MQSCFILNDALDISTNRLNTRQSLRQRGARDITHVWSSGVFRSPPVDIEVRVIVKRLGMFLPSRGDPAPDIRFELGFGTSITFRMCTYSGLLQFNYWVY